jgi:hypothetical protein
MRAGGAPSKIILISWQDTEDPWIRAQLSDRLPALPQAFPRFGAPMKPSAPARRHGTFGLMGPPLAPLPWAAPCRCACALREPAGASRLLHPGHHLARTAGPARLVPASGGHSGWDVLGGCGGASSAVHLRSALSAIHVGCLVTSVPPPGHPHGCCPQQLRAVCRLPSRATSQGLPSSLGQHDVRAKGHLFCLPVSLRCGPSAPVQGSSKPLTRQ